MKMFDVYPLYDVTITKGEGSYVWDEKGDRYLDMYGGHAVISVGHSNRRYVDAVKKQLDELGFYSNSVVISNQRKLAELLGRLSGKEDYRLFLVNSGAEANENAIKLASYHNGRKKVVSFTGSFHGRTSLAAEATDGKSICAPVNITGNLTMLPFNDARALRDYFAREGKNISSVIVEGIQGVGGIRIATPDFLREIRSLCDEYGAVYIADAVQCGCGRTGRYFSHDRAGADADIYTMAKGIGNGFPIGAVAISPEFEARHGILGTTFGGNHLACAAAIAVAEIITDEDLMSNADRMGRYLMDQLRQIDGIEDVRGEGLMIGIEFGKDISLLRKKLVYDKKIFTGSSSNNIIRLLPALNISKKECDEFLDSFKVLLTDGGSC